MLYFYRIAENFSIPMDTLPICIYTNTIHPDFANFLGWGAPKISILSFLSLSTAEKQIRNWVESPT